MGKNSLMFAWYTEFWDLAGFTHVSSHIHMSKRVKDIPKALGLELDSEAPTQMLPCVCNYVHMLVPLLVKASCAQHPEPGESPRTWDLLRPPPLWT